MSSHKIFCLNINVLYDGYWARADLYEMDGVWIVELYGPNPWYATEPDARSHLIIHKGIEPYECNDVLVVSKENSTFNGMVLVDG